MFETKYRVLASITLLPLFPHVWVRRCDFNSKRDNMTKQVQGICLFEEEPNRTYLCVAAISSNSPYADRIRLGSEDRKTEYRAFAGCRKCGCKCSLPHVP